MTRLLKVGTYYPSCLDQFYARNPTLPRQPYDVQHAALMAARFGSSDFWTDALAGFGYEVCELVANAEPLQKRWAREAGATFEGNETWLLEIAAAQIKAYRPDVLIVADYTTFTASFLRRLKFECPAIKLVLGWCAAPYHDPSPFREYHIVLSCVPELVHHFREEGHRSIHVNHAFDPRVLEQLDTNAPPGVDFAFAGSVVNLDKFHRRREELLSELVERTSLQIWAEVSRPSTRQRLAGRARRWAYDATRAAKRAGISQSTLSSTPILRRTSRWQARPSVPRPIDKKIARRARPPLFGLEMFQQLRDSKVVLNTHIDISPHSASNLRLYEATGVGTCLLTDWRENIAAVFEPDAEVVTYRDAGECVEKLNYLLEHEGVRRSVADAGQRRTLREHTFARRAAQLDQIIREAL